MAIYVMSDIHGEYEKYIAMLKKINFTDRDTLYVLGDVLDRGNDPVKVLQDMSMRYNVYPIMGNHEIMALDLLERLTVEITDSNYDTQINSDVLSKLLEWQQNGGDATLKQFKELPQEDRSFLLDYLKDFEPYDVVDVNDKTFILSHSGNISADKKLSEHSLEEITFMRADYDCQVFDDESIYLISGHTPTLAITGKPEIYYYNNNINIDCGAAFGGKLACLRLDDLAEFYV